MALPRLLTRAGPDALACAALFAVACALAALLTRTDVDPDRSYHYALSRVVAEQGIPRALPQVAGIGWDKAFSDKEFLWHQLTGLGYRLAGERGVEAAGVLCTALLLCAAYACARAFARPLPALLWVAGLLGTQAFFAFRATLLRPYVLAIALALGLLAGVLHRRGWVCLLCAALFGLAYHALYVPAALLGLCAALALLLRERGWLRPVGFGAAGLVLGVVLNPYFPQTLFYTRLTLDIALGRMPGPELLGTQGSELARLSLSAFAQLFLGGVLALGAVLAALGVPALRRKVERPAAAALVAAVAAVFLLLAWASPRAAEYALPFTAVALAAVASAYGRLAYALLAVLVAANLPALLQSNAPQPIDRYQRETRAAISHLPAQGPGFVFHCGFDEGAYLLHQRPNLTLVDVLDPLFLALANPELARERQALIRGEQKDAWALLTRLGAAYVICGYPLAVEQLDRDLAFERVWPPSPRAPEPGEGARIWRVLPDAQAPARYRTGQKDAAALEELRLYTPERGALDGTAQARLVQFPRTPAPVGCGLLAPEDRARVSGATAVAVGGGPFWRLFLNGKLLGEGRAHGRGPHARLLPLPAPLREADALILLVCSLSAAPPWGTLAFPSAASLQARCAAVGRPGEASCL